MSALLALFMQVAAQPSQTRPSVSQADLNAIADACRAPRQWLALKGNELIFRGSPDADPDKLECVLKKISAIVARANRGDARASEDK